nr:AbgT family transporter [Sporosalibacterium faouarense]
MEQVSNSLNISKKSFISSVLILLVLILIAGVLTQIIPSGSYERELINGRETINPDSFHYTKEVTYPIWKWFTAPVEVLWSDDGLIVIVIILFLLIIGGSFAILNGCNLLQFIIGKIISKFGHRKYYLLGIIVLSFMLLGSVVGIFEELIPLIPILIALSYSFGWDALTGLGMSLLAAGFGFAAGVANPFTVGVAQKLAGLPMFSGLGFRLLVFIVIYTILTTFLVKYAKKIEKDPALSPVYEEDKSMKNNENNHMDLDISNEKSIYRASIWFGSSILLMFIFIMISSFIQGLSDYSLPIVALLFLIGGVGAGKLSELTNKKIVKIFWTGVLGIAPGVILILMATSVKHIISQGGIMDTILHYAAMKISTTTPMMSLFLIYLLVLIMNFFISSGSAKAFLIMPIVTPLADLVGVNHQLTILAFAFGDGFSNVLYPTNAVLLIGLGLTVVSYPKWFKWIIKLQIVTMVITALLLGLAYIINYGSF